MIRSLLVLALVVSSSVALANRTPTKSNRSQAKNFQQMMKESREQQIRQCVESCIASYDRPGPELKRCVAQCKAQAR